MSFSRRTDGRVAAGVARGRVAVIAVVCALVGSATLMAADAMGAGTRAPARQASALGGSVTITRDSAGIPHIVARNFTALGYGDGYAFAQDNLCTFADDIVTVEGNRSKYFGPNAVAVNYSAGVSSSNLESDLFWRYVQGTGVINAALTAKAPNGLLPQVRQVYTGYVAGYNHYLRSGKLNDPTCKGKPWVKPITLRDMILRGVQIVTEASSQQFIPGMVEAAPPALAGARRAAARRAGLHGAGLSVAQGIAALRKQFDSSDRAQGSNGIGLGALDTRSGHGMVLANPHFPWRGTERFWMAQLDVPGSYDVEGGTLMGFPLIGIGFNRNIAWTHTVSTDDRFVAYQLHLVPGNPTSYYVDGTAVPMGHINVTLKYGHTTVHHTFYTTRWGVVVDVPAVPGNAYIWNGATAYALYDATMPAGPRAANQYLRMGQATSVQSLFGVESKWLAIPTFNTMAADDHGNAYYGDIGAVPAVSQAEITSCLPAGVPTLVFNAARVVTLDGSRSVCAPATVPGTPQKGIFSSASLPHLFRRDYIENSNDSFWLTNPSHPLTGYSPIIGLSGAPVSLRTRLANELIAARAAGSDGLGAPKFTLATLQRMWESDKSELAALVLPALVADCRSHPSQVASNGTTVDLTAACNALASYNGTAKVTAKGGWLFMVWADTDIDPNFFSTAFNASQPLTTPAVLNTSTATPLKWLADAVLNLRAHGVAVGASVGQVQHAPQSSRIPIGGCPGDPSGNGSPNTGCFNAIYAPNGTSAMTGPVNAGPYGQVNDGSSLVMTTELAPAGPIAQGILTYSEATNPKSPWYENLTKLFSRAQWVKLPFTARELALDHPGTPLTLQAP